MAFDLVGIFTSPTAIQILQVVVIFVLTYTVVRFYRIIISRVAGTVPSGLIASFQQIGSWAIWILGVIIILNTLNVSIYLLVVLLFLGGLTMITAYRNILTDMGASQFVSTYQPFKVGEWIEVQDYYGRVIERNLIQTKILTADNEIVIIPNSTLLRRSIVNRTRSGGLRVQIPVVVETKIDLKKIEDYLLGIAADMKVDLLPDSTAQVRVTQVGPQETRLLLLLQIANPAKRDQIMSDVQKRFYELLAGLS
ncbi:MAG TPA: mechanosensitive ion channel family protein [Candidatus Bathyarchaeia archaeon]|nr:mechanosensitive ion channel family protein [Candidatus Bathyarchaeia archaeon]